MFCDIGMPEIARYEPWPLPVMAACCQAGRLWVVAHRQRNGRDIEAADVGEQPPYTRSPQHERSLVTSFAADMGLGLAASGSCG